MQAGRRMTSFTSSAPTILREPQFGGLLDCVQEYAVVVLEPDGRLASWNIGAQRLTRYDADVIRDLTGRRQRASRLEAIAEVTRAILESRGTEEVLQIVAGRARELVDAGAACVMTPDDAGGTLVVRVADGDVAETLVGATL